MLTKIELESLINDYKLEKSNLEFKLKRSRATLSELQGQMKELIKAEKEAEKKMAVKKATPAKKKTARRGRPAAKKTTVPTVVEVKTSVEAPAKPAAKRGRPAKAKTAAAPKPAAKRGRPTKSKPATTAIKADDKAVKPVVKRGRPAKSKTVTTAAPKAEVKTATATPAKPAAKRGRPAKKTTAKAAPKAKKINKGDAWKKWTADQIKAAGKIVTRHDLMKMSSVASNNAPEKLKEDKLEKVISQALYKLTKVDKTIISTKKPNTVGRTLSYGIKSWFSRNKIKPEHV